MTTCVTPGCSRPVVQHHLRCSGCEDEMRYRAEEQRFCALQAGGWYAEGGGVCQGPFMYEDEARESTRLTRDMRVRQCAERGTMSPYPWDLRVWKE